MKVIVCGAGQVGAQIANHLSLEKNDITVIDSNSDLVSQLTNTLDISGITGCASHPDVLKKAGIDSDTILISVTNDDEVNIVACQIAKQIFDVKKTICRLSDSSYIKNLSAFGKEMIDIPISP